MQVDIEVSKEMSAPPSERCSVIQYFNEGGGEQRLEVTNLPYVLSLVQFW